LHVEAFEVGGNDISVKCKGSTTNLHSVGTALLTTSTKLTRTGLGLVFWQCIGSNIDSQQDTSLIGILLSAQYGNSAATWASSLANRIKVRSTVDW
jgi:hypothetical protein